MMTKYNLTPHQAKNRDRWRELLKKEVDKKWKAECKYAYQEGKSHMVDEYGNALAKKGGSHRTRKN